MQTKTEKLFTRLTGQDYKAFKKLADKQHRTVSDLLRILIKQALGEK